jgi:hypothetical protein
VDGVKEVGPKAKLEEEEGNKTKAGRKNERVVGKVSKRQLDRALCINYRLFSVLFCTYS